MRRRPPKANRRVYCFDLDGTLCTNTEGGYDQARPYPERIRHLRALRRAGHEIVICTARGTKTGINWAALTRRQLARWKVPYDRLYFGKPYADIYIDDKAQHVGHWLAGRRRARKSRGE